MVKKKGARDINPADAFRKAQRAKEIERNKKERKFLRDASKLRSEPEVLKKELEEILALEEDGKLSQTLRLKRQAVQRAYDAALRKKREEELAAKGLLPPSAGGVAAKALPLPPAPPLPAGPAPVPLNIPVPLLPPPAGPPPGAPDAGAPVLPPPAYPPPGGATAGGPLPPPAFPPPGVLPPPGMPPPNVLPPPAMPPPGFPPLGVAAASGASAPGVLLPPPPGAPPGFPGAAPGVDTQTDAAPRREVKATIAGASTAVKRPLAQNDKTVTSMVPASVRIRREQAEQKPAVKKVAVSKASVGFGLMPAIGPSRPAAEPVAPALGKGGVDSKYAEFLSAMGELGAFEG